MRRIIISAAALLLMLVLCLNLAVVEGSGALVGGFHRERGAGGAGGTLSEVLRNRGLDLPFLAADYAVTSSDCLDKEHAVAVVDVSGESRSVNAHSRVNCGQLVQLRLAGVFTLRLTGELRLVGQDVDVLPCRVGGKLEVAVIHCRSETTNIVMLQCGPIHDLVFADVVDASFDAREFGSSLTPSERLLYCGTIRCHSDCFIYRLNNYAASASSISLNRR